MATRMTDGGGTQKKKYSDRQIARKIIERGFQRSYGESENKRNAQMKHIPRSTGSAYGDKMRSDWERGQAKKQTKMFEDQWNRQLNYQMSENERNKNKSTLTKKKTNNMTLEVKKRR